MSMNCREFMKCEGDKVKDCPAYPENGKVCWLVAGSLCPEGIKGRFAKKFGDCVSCPSYRKIRKRTEGHLRKIHKQEVVSSKLTNK